MERIVKFMAKKINKYIDMSIDELNKELINKKESLFNLRFQKSLQQLEHPLLIRNLKRDIARIKTRISNLNK